MVERGLSSIVAIVAIVLITVVAVAIVRISVSPVIDDDFLEIRGDVNLEIVSGGGYTVWDDENRLVSVQVKKIGEGNISGFNLIFVLGGESVIHFVEEVPGINEMKVYYLNLSGYPGGLEVIRVAPVFLGGRVGDVTSELKLGNIEKGDLKRLLDEGTIDVGEVESPNGGYGVTKGDPDVDHEDVSYEPYELVEGAYYVAVDGDDGNNGSVGSPFATIQKARDVIQGTVGNTVYIRGGTYYLAEMLKFNDSDSGSAGAPNVYIGYPGEDPVIKGSVKIPVSEFSLYSGNIMQADLSAYGVSEFYQLFMNGERLIPARYPNFDPSDPIEGGWLYAADDTTLGNINYHVEDFDPSGWDVSDARMDIFAGPNYGNYIFDVDVINEANRIISINSGSRSVSSGDRYYLQNIFEELDSENEWYFDVDTKMLYLYPEHALIVSDEISVPVVDYTIFLNDVDYFEFKGVSVEESKITSFHGSTTSGGNSFYVYDSEHVSIDSCKIRNSGAAGIHIEDGKDVTVKNCEIFETGRNGIYAKNNEDYFKQLESSEYLITNNIIHDVNAVMIGWGNGAGIMTSTVGSTISYNHIYDVPRIGILLYTGNDNVVEYNHIHDVNTKTQDTAAIYFVPLSWTHRGNVIRYNFVNGSGGLCEYEGNLYPFCYTFGIYIDNTGSGTQIYGNTVMNSVNGGVYIHGGRDNIIEDNTIVENIKDAQIVFSSWTLNPSWWDHLQNLEVNGYNSALYYEKYPEINTITENILPGEVMGYNDVKGNVIIYPNMDTDPYSMKGFDFSTSEIDNNIIWQGLEPLSVGSISWDQWQQDGFDVNSQYVSDVFESTIYNDFEDDYILLVNTEHGDKVFVLENGMCDLDGDVVSGPITLEPFESKVLLSCFCNNDVECNNRETISTCPADCSETCEDGIKNKDETDMDCGGIICDGCDLGKSCGYNLDCLSGHCSEGVCGATIFPTDYVSYWKLDTQTAGETPDESGKNPGILIDNALIVSDEIRGQVVSLDGDADVVEIDERTPLDFTQDFTVLAWYNKKDISMGEIVARAHGGAGIGYRWDWYTNRFRIDANFDGEWTILNQIGSGLETDKWQHAAFVFNSSNDFTFYLNGNLNSIRSAPGQIFYDGDSKVLIGGAWAHWNGSIDDVMIFNRSLSETEIQEIYCGQGGEGVLCS